MIRQFSDYLNAISFINDESESYFADRPTEKTALRRIQRQIYYKQVYTINVKDLDDTDGIKLFWNIVDRIAVRMRGDGWIFVEGMVLFKPSQIARALQAEGKLDATEIHVKEAQKKKRNELNKAT